MPDVDNPDTYQNCRLSLFGEYLDFNNGDNIFKAYRSDGGENVNEPKLSVTVQSSSTKTKKVSVRAEGITVRNSAGTITQNIVSGDSVTVSDTVYAAPYVIGYGATTAWDNEPALYLFVPQGFTLGEVTLGNKPIKAQDITNDTQYFDSAPIDAQGNPVKVYRFLTPEGSNMGYYDESVDSHRITYKYTLYTPADMSTQTLNLGHVAYLGTGSGAATDFTEGTKPYGFKFGQLSSLSTEVKIQERKTLDVSSTARIITGGAPTNTWLTYDPANAAETRAVVGPNYQAEYKVTAVNRTGARLASASIFVPIPKKGANFGSVTNPEGSWQFDMNLELEGKMPDGWTLSYIKLNQGKQFASNQRPLPSDYTVVDSAKEADMILLTAENGVEVGKSVDFTFLATSPTDADALSAGAINTWDSIVYYELGTTGFYATTLSKESLEVRGGIISGIVYNDINNNGVMDAGEKGIKDVEVTLTENWAYHFDRNTTTQTTKTDDQGMYSFPYARGLSVEESLASPAVQVAHIARTAVADTGASDDTYYEKAQFTNEITVTNPNVDVYQFSPVTQKGNKPSLVTPTADQSSASKSDIRLTLDKPEAEVDAGLVSATVIYKPGEHGIFEPVTFDSQKIGSSTPTFNGELDDQTSNLINAGLPKGQPGWKFVGWKKVGTVANARALTALASSSVTDGVDATVAPGITTYEAQWEHIVATVIYKPGDHGTFKDDTHTDLVIGTATPDYAGDKDTDSTNTYNAGNPSGQYGWVFAGWEPEVADNVAEGTTIYVAQWKQKSAKVTYTKGDHGTFEDDVHTTKEDGTDLYVNDPTPEYAGETDSADTNAYNVDNPTGE
ncbi:MAG: SdrD B-like domain-containing protein [Atopobiaceae bacterium]